MPRNNKRRGNGNRKPLSARAAAGEGEGEAPPPGAAAEDRGGEEARAERLRRLALLLDDEINHGGRHRWYDRPDAMERACLAFRSMWPGGRRLFDDAVAAKVEMLRETMRREDAGEEKRKGWRRAQRWDLWSKERNAESAIIHSDVDLAAIDSHIGRAYWRDHATSGFASSGFHCGVLRGESPEIDALVARDRRNYLRFKGTLRSTGATSFAAPAMPPEDEERLASLNRRLEWLPRGSSFYARSVESLQEQIFAVKEEHARRLAAHEADVAGELWVQLRMIENTDDRNNTMKRERKERMALLGELLDAGPVREALERAFAEAGGDGGGLVKAAGRTAAGGEQESSSQDP